MTSLLAGVEPPRAVFSPCGLYRFLLRRRWAPGPSALFVMLNPSTADAEQDDPTIRKCIGFAHRWGCGGIEVVNLYAYRATDPRDLLEAHRPIGDGNDEAILAAAVDCEPIVLAWGAHANGLLRRIGGDGRAAYVASLFAVRVPMCLGTSADGSPRHPLMVRYSQPLVPWRAP